MDPRLALLDADQLSRGAARRGRATQDDRLFEHPVRAAWLPRLRALRLPCRCRRRDQASRSQPQPRLVLGRQAQSHGRNGRAALLRPAKTDHRGRPRAGRGATPGPRRPVCRAALSADRCPPQLTSCSSLFRVFPDKMPMTCFLECRETPAFQDRASRRIVTDYLVGDAGREPALLVRRGGFAPLDDPALECLFGPPLALRIGSRSFRPVACFAVFVSHRLATFSSYEVARKPQSNKIGSASARRPRGPP